MVAGIHAIVESRTVLGYSQQTQLHLHHHEQDQPLPNPPAFAGEGEMNEERKSNVILNYQESPKYIKELVLELRKKQTKSEEIIWELLRRKQLF